MGSWYTPVDCSVPISAISIYNYCVETADNLVWVEQTEISGFECRFGTQGGQQLKREHTSQWLQNGNVSCTRNTYLLICADMQNRLLMPLTI